MQGAADNTSNNSHSSTASTSGSTASSLRNESGLSNHSDEKKDLDNAIILSVNLNLNDVEKVEKGVDNLGFATEAGEEKLPLPPSYEEAAKTIQMPDDGDGEKKDDEENEDDPWQLVVPPDTGKPWKELTTAGKIGRVSLVTLKILSIVFFLYLFICSIDLLGAAFQLVGGRTAGEAFKSPLLQNPICGLVIGIAITALLQSSSTSTSIVVTMVAAGILTVEQGIYIIMGANIGTSITSCLVALSQVAEKNQFRRAFASAMVLYMFNLLSCVLLLPLEYFTGYLYEVTYAIVQTIDVDTSNPDNPQFLKVITQPLIHLIIQVDKDVIAAIGVGSFSQKRPLTKYICDENPAENIIDYECYGYGDDVEDSSEYIEVKDSKTHPNFWATGEKIENITSVNGSMTENDNCSSTSYTKFSWEVPDFNSENTSACHHIFVGAGLPSEYTPVDGWPKIGLSDTAVGVILLIISLIILCVCLMGMVKVLSSLLKGSVLKMVRNVINSDLPGGRFGKELAGYLAIVAGAGLTILVQSSSVFTSALNPLAGMGIVSLERVYPLTIGAAIGTTVTSILAAFTSDPSTIRDALQCAFAHLFFNLTGFLLFYPIPKLRKLPCYLSMQLGNTTADYKWFAIVVLALNFFILPLLVLGLSIPGWYVLVAVSLPIIAAITIIVIINIMQTKCPTKLPNKCRSWEWCPIWLHSLEPYDKYFKKICRCKMCQEPKTESQPDIHVDPIVMEVVDGKLEPVKDGSVNKESLFSTRL